MSAPRSIDYRQLPADQSAREALFARVQYAQCCEYFHARTDAEAFAAACPGGRVLFPPHMRDVPEFGGLLVVRAGTTARAARHVWNRVQGCNSDAHWEMYDVTPGVYEMAKAPEFGLHGAPILRQRLALPLARAIIARSSPLLVDAFEAATQGL